MSNRIAKSLFTGAALLLSSFTLTLWGAEAGQFSPGRRTIVLAHNAYPDQGKYTDRLDRAISAGTPFAVEIDLVWAVNPKTGKNASLITHSAKAFTGDEPTLKTFFFDRVRPIVEKALKDNDKKNWPLVTLYLDIKNDPPEHLDYVWSQLGEYETWLTTAVKTKNSAEISPLDVKPLLVLLEDKVNDVKEDHFFNRLPAGAKLRAFGTAKLSPPSGEGLTKKQLSDLQMSMKPEDLVREKATNYRRWWGASWEMVEKGPQNATGEFTPDEEARLKALVKHAHDMGYLMSFYCLDGFEAGKGQGWEENYNFGSLQSGTVRWKAAVKAGVDFISTDQYEDVTKVIRGRI